ncbi:ABC transporter ATP-binding protein [Halieaceae bacterium IMCC14734]|uniref:ABC transporter ATP-binding protein n=1 Tax=Candidatus Litorirhabdus singularis TaxID=2518993 RepID=A0ABT3TFG6_9GAMM|nr:dipeptide ABC transporter ATP-binding protein [Candidatus Litorirhabdus singularis]MCX2981036.1 ABC transporter ATP-binding protein [Candidatus Litorirhabdus singularis]
MKPSLPNQRRLEVRDLKVAVKAGAEQLLRGVSFNVDAGEILALVGESGSGKSITSLSLMRLLPDALQITGGQVSMQDTDIFSLTEARMQAVRGRRVAMIFQNAQTALNPVQKAGQQIAETLKLNTALRGAGLRQRVIELLEEVGIPEADARYDFYPHQLSGGQQQRVMIAMALACDPELLIADEPTTALDVTIQDQVLKLITQLARKRQLAVLLITHDMGVVKNTADRVAVMYQGEIIESAPVAEFFLSPQQDYSRRLIASLPDLEKFQQAPAVVPLLQVEDVEVHFPIRKGVLQRVVDYTRAVDGVSLQIGAGETYALVGESGSGKSTLGRAILNLERATAGRISFDGQDLESFSTAQMLPLRKRMQVIFQDPYSSMNPRMTVGDIIEEGMESLKVESRATERQERIVALLERVQLNADHRSRYPHEFSGGQLQRIAIARALAVRPDLIICDEPTSALDVSIRAEVLELLRELQREYELSYLFITHDLSIVPSLAHHVGVMQAGKIVEQGTAQQILQAPQHPYTQALLASVPRLDQH